MSKKRKKKKNYNQNFFILFGFIILGSIAFTLDPEGFGENIFLVGEGFVYILILMIIGIILVELNRDK